MSSFSNQASQPSMPAAHVAENNTMPTAPSGKPALQGAAPVEKNKPKTLRAQALARDARNNRRREAEAAKANDDDADLEKEDFMDFWAPQDAEAKERRAWLKEHAPATNTDQAHLVNERKSQGLAPELQTDGLRVKSKKQVEQEKKKAEKDANRARALEEKRYGKISSSTGAIAEDEEDAELFRELFGEEAFGEEAFGEEAFGEEPESVVSPPKSSESGPKANPPSKKRKLSEDSEDLQQVEKLAVPQKRAKMASPGATSTSPLPKPSANKKPAKVTAAAKPAAKVSPDASSAEESRKPAAKAQRPTSARTSSKARRKAAPKIKVAASTIIIDTIREKLGRAFKLAGREVSGKDASRDCYDQREEKAGDEGLDVRSLTRYQFPDGSTELVLVASCERSSADATDNTLRNTMRDGIRSAKAGAPKNVGLQEQEAATDEDCREFMTSFWRDNADQTMRTILHELPRGRFVLLMYGKPGRKAPAKKQRLAENENAVASTSASSKRKRGDDDDGEDESVAASSMATKKSLSPKKRARPESAAKTRNGDSRPTGAAAMALAKANVNDAATSSPATEDNADAAMLRTAGIDNTSESRTRSKSHTVAATTANSKASEEEEGTASAGGTKKIPKKAGEKKRQRQAVEDEDSDDQDAYIPGRKRARNV